MNTFLRGCLRIGAVQSALSAYSLKFKNIYDATNDDDCNNKLITTSMEETEHSNEEEEEEEGIKNELETFQYQQTTQLYLIALLCQSFRLSHSISIIESFLLNNNIDNSNSYPLDLSSISCHISKIFALLGFKDKSLFWYEKSLQFLERAKTFNLRSSIYSKIYTNKDNSNNMFATSDSSSHSTVPSKSLVLFQQHQREELEYKLETIYNFFQRSSSFAPLANSDYNNDKNNISNPFIHLYQLFNHLSYLLYFGVNGYGDIQDESHHFIQSFLHPSEFLIYALRDKFGLNEISKTYLENISEPDVNIKRIFRPLKEAACKKLLSVIDSATGYINFSILFYPISYYIEKVDDVIHSTFNTFDRKPKYLTKLSSIPIKLEIGSGSGIHV
jgi:hypothetical protein